MDSGYRFVCVAEWPVFDGTHNRKSRFLNSMLLWIAAVVTSLNDNSFVAGWAGGCLRERSWCGRQRDAIPNASHEEEAPGAHPAGDGAQGILIGFFATYIYLQLLICYLMAAMQAQKKKKKANNATPAPANADEAQGEVISSSAATSSVRHLSQFIIVTI